MPTENQSAFDADALVAALEKMAATPNAKKVTLKDKISEPRILDAIRKAQAAKYTPADIAELMTAMGIEIRPSTLAVYLREIEAETKGGTDGKQGAKSKANKPRTTAATSENKTAAQPEKPAEKSAAKPDDKSAGKTLTSKPAMGGAFDTNNL